MTNAGNWDSCFTDKFQRRRKLPLTFNRRGKLANNADQASSKQTHGPVDWGSGINQRGKAEVPSWQMEEDLKMFFLSYALCGHFQGLNKRPLNVKLPERFYLKTKTKKLLLYCIKTPKKTNKSIIEFFRLNVRFGELLLTNYIRLLRTAIAAK